MSGWIKLHRTIKDHFLFDFNEPDKALAWVDLLLSANFDDSKVKIKGTVIDVRRGQFCASQVTLQKRWNMSQNKVKRFLLLLKKEGMIDFQTNALTTIITICNYDNFQGDERANERANERADERSTDEQTNDIKRSKEDKELKNKDIIGEKKSKLDFSKWPQQPSEQTLNDWQAMRKRQKAQVTQTVINRLTAELTKAVNAGYTVDQCIAECCLRNWRGFQLEWMSNTGTKPNGYQQTNSNHNAGNHGRIENNTERAMRIAREAAERIATASGTSH